jgi:hypothetical protein
MGKTITLELRDEDLSFIQRYAKERGMSVSDSIDRIIGFLRRTERHPVHPEVIALAGILQGVDPDAARDEYLTRKHL